MKLKIELDLEADGLKSGKDYLEMAKVVIESGAESCNASVMIESIKQHLGKSYDFRIKQYNSDPYDFEEELKAVIEKGKE